MKSIVSLIMSDEYVKLAAKIRRVYVNGQTGQTWLGSEEANQICYGAVDNEDALNKLAKAAGVERSAK